MSYDDTETAIHRKHRSQTEGLALWDVAQPSGVEVKEEGMRYAREAGDVQRWRRAFAEQVEALARRGEPFTSEDVTALVGLPRDSQQNRNSAVGAMMNGLAKRGIIRKTGQRVKSAYPQSHAREILQWIGVAL